MNNNSFEGLYCGLQEFGLNPSDWLLVPLAETDAYIQFEISSIEEPDLNLHGQAEKKSLRWQSMEWTI
ncbi:MAG: hypothetical protein AB7O96_19260 [Pseudobdellovibrionaceae bacterium]